MVEYISKADAVFAACKVLNAFGGCHMGPFCPDSGCREVREIFETIPAADVKPVVRGKWIDTCVRDWTCSVCKGKIDKVRHVDGYYYKNLPNFCPDCGAKMDGGQDDV